MDVKGAYLNGELDIEIYMKQAEGFVVQGKEDWVHRLKKTLYGLKQSGRVWYFKLHSFLISLGFARSACDHSLYTFKSSNNFTMIAIYVDDLVIATISTTLLRNIKAELSNTFEMTDLGELHWSLGLDIIQDRSKHILSINQKKYINHILERFKMTDCKPISTPMDPNAQLQHNENDTNISTDTPYQSAVGSLMYVMVATRPDIAYAVGAVSRFNTTPQQHHWAAIKRIFRYLRATSDFELQFSSSDPTTIGYCDSDWAGDRSDRRSTTGYLFTLENGAISWKSKKQQTVALSSTEAEYMAATHATKEAIWLRKLMQELNHQQLHPTTIHIDNQGAQALTRNPVQHNRSKHIDIQYHFVREQVEANQVQLKYLETSNMPADILTKPIARDAHERHLKRIGLVLGCHWEGMKE